MKPNETLGFLSKDIRCSLKNPLSFYSCLATPVLGPSREQKGLPESCNSGGDFHSPGSPDMNLHITPEHPHPTASFTCPD